MEVSEKNYIWVKRLLVDVSKNGAYMGANDMTKKNDRENRVWKGIEVGVWEADWSSGKNYY